MTVSNEQKIPTTEKWKSRQPKDVTLTWPELDPSLFSPAVDQREPEPALPEKYDRTVLYLLVRDPDTLYAFWNLSGQTLHEIARTYSVQVWEKAPKILRVHQLDQAASFDLEVGPATSWYITNLSPDQSYQVEYGFLSPENTFVSLAISNRVHSPRNSFSDLTDEEWLTIAELYGTSVGLRGQRGSEEVLAAAKAYLKEQMGSEAVSSISSPWGGFKPPEKPEPLELEAETILTIQGRTTPGSTVTFNNQNVATDSQGRFVFSLALPEGDTPIEIKSSKQQKEKRLKLDLTRRMR